MRKQLLKLIFLAFGAVFFTSCNNLLYTTLDVLRPAKVAFNLNANNLLIINNTVTQPANYGHKTQLLNDISKSSTISNDSLPIFCLAALTEDLDSKGFFSSIQLIPNSINKGTDFSNPMELNSDSVNNLSSSHHANVILSLDNIKVIDQQSEFYLLESSTYLSTLELRYETKWSIHYPNNPQTTTLQVNDTAYWESESYIKRNSLNGLPKRTDALIDGALNIGHKSVNQLVPYWDKVDRYFFNPSNKLMKQGMDSVYMKKWKSAINSWQKALISSNNKSINAEAANNIAVAYEIIGDIDNALEYATKSLNLLPEFTTIDYDSRMRLINYIKELIQRKSEIKILKQQLGE